MSRLYVIIKLHQRIDVHFLVLILHSVSQFLYVPIYRVIQEESALLWEMIV